MRYGRAKAARRTLQFFERTQGLHPPYRVLLDGNFITAFQKHKLDLVARVQRLLQTHRLEFVVTRSTLQELLQLQQHGTVFVETYQWAVKNCHKILETQDIPTTYTATIPSSLDDKSPGSDILKVLTDSDESSPKYILASQHESLLAVVRSLGSMPIVRLARGSVLLLEHPSTQATSKDRHAEKRKWNHVASEQEKQLLQVVHEERQQQRPQQQGQVRRKHKAKGPNPLSCKKRQSSTGPSTGERPNKRRRRNKSSAAVDSGEKER